MALFPGNFNLHFLQVYYYRLCFTYKKKLSGVGQNPKKDSL